eukprot:gene16529-18857_t
MHRDYVNFLVDGMYYCMLLEDIGKYPESYFSAAIKKEWSPEENAPIIINRGGKIFRYIVNFHNHGMLCQAQKKIPFDVVTKIQSEADFFNLPSLVEACESYITDNIGSHMNGRNVRCQYSSEQSDDLINVVSAIWAPFCLKGFRSFRGPATVLKSSTLQAFNLDELCAAAVEAPFGKGIKTLVDKNVRDALEITADQLDPGLWKQFKPDAYPFHEEKEFLEEDGYVGNVAKEGYELAVNDETRTKVFAALDKKLECYQDVVICLTHLYPMCQADPACLKGGDALLYQLMVEREKEYELSIVPVKIHQREEDDYHSPFEAVIVDLEGELSGTFAKDSSRHTLLTIPVHCLSNHEVFHNPYLEYVGNNAQAEETVYLVTGLQIRKRLVKEEPHQSSESAQEVTDVVLENVQDTSPVGDYLPKLEKGVAELSTATDSVPKRKRQGNDANAESEQAPDLISTVSTRTRGAQKRAANV